MKWNTLRQVVTIIVIGIIVNGCSGGGSSNNDSPMTYTISGTVLIPTNVATDGDVNDPNATYIPNDTLEDAQNIPYPMNINGYVNVANTGEEGRSKTIGDRSDYFVGNFDQDYVVSLTIGNYPDADLDIYLYNDIGQLIDMSIGTGQTETIVLPSIGVYFIEVYAYAYASNYALSISQSASPSTALDLQLSADFIPGEVIVRFKDNIRNIASQAATIGMYTKNVTSGQAVLLNYNKEGVTQVFRALKMDTSKQDTRLVQSSDRHKLDTLQIIKALRKRQDVLYAEPNYILKATTIPNDELYPLQWNYPLINLPEAWDITTGSESVSIAVIDSGVLLNHPDLQNQLIGGYDFVDMDNNPDDPIFYNSSFHGTHVAGIIAAAANNIVGIAGTAWLTKVMPVRVLDKEGNGSSYRVGQGMLYAAGLQNDSGFIPVKIADIINLSLGGTDRSQYVENICIQVSNEGIIIVAAAGNNNNSIPFYPASHEGIISVSAVNSMSNRAYYSNYGNHIDVAAPGGNFNESILSTCGDDSTSIFRFTYENKCGTSMAAPHVAGVISLMKAIYPMLTPNQVNYLLMNETITEDIGDPGWDTFFGYGLIDAHKAVIAAQILKDDDSVIPSVLIITPISLIFEKNFTKHVLIAQNGGEEDLIVESVYNDADWLVITPTNVDNNGLGDYTITTDRTDLDNGTYTATVTFVSSENTISVPVTVDVDNTVITDNVGYYYIIIIDDATDETIDQVEIENNGNYLFTDVLPGLYKICVGTDFNNNFFLCECGEIGAVVSTSVNCNINGLSIGVEPNNYTEVGYNRLN